MGAVRETRVQTINRGQPQITQKWERLLALYREQEKRSEASLQRLKDNLTDQQ